MAPQSPKGPCPASTWRLPIQQEHNPFRGLNKAYKSPSARFPNKTDQLIEACRPSDTHHHPFESMSVILIPLIYSVSRLYVAPLKEPGECCRSMMNRIYTESSPDATISTLSPIRRLPTS